MIRILTLGLVLALGIWLMLDRSPAERRAAAINQALQQGQLGGLTTDETAELQEMLQRLVAAAGLNLPVALNQPLQLELRAERIQVFTTLPAARNVSKTERGNAIYDGTIDAIFIDLDIVRPARAVPLYTHIQIFDAFSGARTYGYLAFVFLHELGHRALHRNQREFLDAVVQGTDAIARKYEREADEFALRAIRADFQKSGAIGRYTGPNNLDGYGFEAALAEMMNGTVRSLLFSAVPYSPFYADAAHPTFLSRTLGFLGNTDVGQGRTHGRLRLVQTELSRIAEVASRPLVEIQVPEAITSVTSTRQGLAILAKDGRRYTVDPTALAGSDKTAGTYRVSAVPAETGQRPSVEVAGTVDAYPSGPVYEVPTATGVERYEIGDRWQSQGPEATGAEICLWKVTGDDPPQAVMCHPLIASAVPEGRFGDGWPHGEVLLRRTGGSEATGFVADVHGDSVYTFDLHSRTAHVLFHPGGLDFVVLPSGNVVLYARGSHKAFVVKPLPLTASASQPTEPLAQALQK